MYSNFRWLETMFTSITGQSWTLLMWHKMNKKKCSRQRLYIHSDSLAPSFNCPKLDSEQNICFFALCLVLQSHHGLKSFGPVLEAIQDVITSTSRFTSFDISARRILESTPRVLPTSLATVSHGVPTVRFVRSSLPRLTASAIAGGTSGRA